MPMLSYSTFLGASGAHALGIARDRGGNILVVGRTFGLFPVANAFQPSSGGGTDVFVCKVDPTGTQLIYSTYLGGSGEDEGLGIAVDGAGNAYVTGFTTSPNFPVTPGAFQTALAGGSDAFVAKLDPKGRLIYATYLGGSADDRALDIAVDTTGNAYVTGYTASGDFPVRGGRGPWRWPWRRALQRTHGGGTYDAFVSKLDPTGSGLVYSTYLGGSGEDGGTGIGLCGDHWAHITGVTDSPNFPTTPNGHQPALIGPQNAFVAKVNFAGTSLEYSTYLGGGADQGTDIAVTGDANAYVTGFTDSSSFPTTPGAYQSASGGGVRDAFVARFDRSGTLGYSTYLGGSGIDEGTGIAVDQAGNAYVAGTTVSPNFPAVNAIQSSYGGGPFDGFVAALDPKGAALLYSTWLGGTDDDRATSVAVDQAGAAYVTGWTSSGNFPTANPYQSTAGGSPDVFIATLS